MSDQEEAEGEAHEGPAPANPTAVDLALGTAGRGGAVDEDARDFLRKQARLIEIQTEHLHEQRELQLAHLRVRRWKDRVHVGLNAAAAVLAIAAAAALLAMVWNASQDRGLVIQAFSTPPDLAQRGATGQVLAAQLLDRLTTLEQSTVQAQPPGAFKNDWGDDIKIEIPDTGVSIGEVNRWLHAWLGHARRISGEVVRTPAGLAVTVRAGGSPGRTFTGAEGDLDKLMQQAAEAVFADTDPFRWGGYLSDNKRTAEAVALYSRLSISGSREDRARAFEGWANAVIEPRVVIGRAVEAIRLDPRFPSAHEDIAWAEAQLGHAAIELEANRTAAALRKAGVNNGDAPWAASLFAHEDRALAASALGDHRAAETEFETGAEPTPDEPPVACRHCAAGSLLRAAYEAAADHDPASARALRARALETGGGALSPGQTSFMLHAYMADWPAVAAMGDDSKLIDQARTVLGGGFEARVAPSLARAYAMTGRPADAAAVIGATPLDCYACLRARGAIAAQAHDWKTAAAWFARAARLAPGLPAAYADWGRMLLDKGEVDAAVVKLEQARALGPHFADPEEALGEALLRKGDAAGAVGKFEAAAKDAPKWKRLHAAWGEALAKLGRADEARREGEIAGRLEP